MTTNPDIIGTPPGRQATPLGPLFDAPAPSVPRPTSEAAGDALDTPTGRQRRLTHRTQLLMLLAAGDKTREELEQASGLDGNTVRPRIAELLTGGWIAASGLTRTTTHGRAAEVLTVTPQGTTLLSHGAGQ